MKSYIEFFNGYKMPTIGLGTWQATDPQELEAAINEALTIGYRHFDTATLYQNEGILGTIFKKWIDSGKIKREELFIVTKLPFIGLRPAHVNYFLEKSLKSLQLDYVDLYLMHGPMGLKYVDDNTLLPFRPDGNIDVDVTTDLEATWKTMEEQVTLGLTRSIGISNFTIPQIQRIVNVAKIHPANIQVEMNVITQQRDLMEFCKKLNITVCAYGPVGSPGRIKTYAELGIKYEMISLLEAPTVVQIARKYDKTPGQILIRFLAQLGVAVIPKSTNLERLKQNFEVFDFELKPDDVNLLYAMDRGDAGRTFKFTDLKGAEEHPECPDSLA